jgi:hypothetical protein
VIQIVNAFLSGAATLACAAIALFYMRYWRRTHDRLFVALALAFSMLALERTVLVLVPPAYEGRHLIYLARLAAFVLICAGIIDKNRSRRGIRGG